MFRRKKDDERHPETRAAMPEEAGDIDAPPLKPFSKKGSHVPTPAKPPSSSGYRAEIPRRIGIPGSGRRIERPRSAETETKKLIVGREISFSGTITSCDKLVVEGSVEASLMDARMIEVAPTGYFKGDARVEEADISGQFEGELIAYDKLVVRAGGRVSGSVRYGRIVIESGGEVSGDMQALSAADQIPAQAPHAAEDPDETDEADEDPEDAAPEKA